MNITLTPLAREDVPAFCKALQAAFAVAVVEQFGFWEGEPIPPDRDVWASYDKEGAASYHIQCDGETVGGVMLKIDANTQHNEVGFLFISPERHSKGLGQAAWQAIEAQYPETRVWSLVTPYFERRNIHFYVNKCGFHIVEFYNEHHPDPNDLAGGDGLFRFEKVMNHDR